MREGREEKRGNRYESGKRQGKRENKWADREWERYKCAERIMRGNEQWTRKKENEQVIK